MNCPHEAASHPEVKYILEVAPQSHILILDFMALKLRVWMVSVAHPHPESLLSSYTTQLSL